MRHLSLRLVGIIATIPFMPTVEKLSIALPPEMADLLHEAVKSGEYASASEVFAMHCGHGSGSANWRRWISENCAG